MIRGKIKKKKKNPDEAGTAPVTLHSLVVLMESGGFLIFDR